MHIQHTHGMIRSSPMAMYDSDIRPIYGAVFSVHTACYIYILGVHEKTLVKQACVTQSIFAKEHETALMIWNVPGNGLVKMFQQISVFGFDEKTLGMKRRIKTSNGVGSMRHVYCFSPFSSVIAGCKVPISGCVSMNV